MDQEIDRAEGPYEVNLFFELGLEDLWQLENTPVSGIHREVLKGDFRNVRRRIESGESVNQRETQRNLSLLHMAVLENQLEILDYLLSREGIEVDARCSEGKTPLFVATGLRHIKSVERLIRAGCDVNLSDYSKYSPLHMSVEHKDICHLLLRHGARVDAVNKYGQTLLHEAMNYKDPEIVHMLLYYNADANIPDYSGFTPFIAALYWGYVNAQEALFDYVDDFDRTTYDSPWYFGSTLKYALLHNSPFIKDIIERCTNVYYGEDTEHRDGDDCAFSACLFTPVDLPSFKMVWERLHDNDTKDTIDLLHFLQYFKSVPTFLQVIIENDNFEPALRFFCKGENYLLFVNKFVEKKLKLGQLTALTCRLLQYGFRATSHDIHTIFSHYGYCELFRILLYMDNDFTLGWLPHMVLPRLMCDIECDLRSAADQVNDIPKENVMQLLEYSICPRLIDALTVKYSDDEQMSTILSRLPRVPSLIELARNAARKHIWRAFKISTTCQFYTTVDHLDIPEFYKTVLTFKRKIYRVEQ